jgi:hypothetical protein
MSSAPAVQFELSGSFALVRGCCDILFACTSAPWVHLPARKVLLTLHALLQILLLGPVVADSAVNELRHTTSGDAADQPLQATAAPPPTAVDGSTTLAASLSGSAVRQEAISTVSNDAARAHIVRVMPALYVSLLATSGTATGRWEQLAADLLAFLLAAAPNLKSYTGNIHLYKEMEDVARFRLFSGYETAMQLETEVASAAGSSTAGYPARVNVMRPSLVSAGAASAANDRHRDIVGWACASSMFLLLKCARISYVPLLY